MKRIPSITDFLPVITVNSMKASLKDRFRLGRKELKLSQQKLAKHSGVSYGSIRRFESSGAVSLSSLLRMSQAMGLIDEFDPLFKRPRIKNLKDFK